MEGHFVPWWAVIPGASTPTAPPEWAQIGARPKPGSAIQGEEANQPIISGDGTATDEPATAASQEDLAEADSQTSFRTARIQVGLLTLHVLSQPASARFTSIFTTK